MPQKLLNHPQIGSPVKEMGGESMAQHMWMNPLVYRSGIFLQYLLDPSGGETLSIPIKKQGVAPLFAEENESALLEVMA